MTLPDRPSTTVIDKPWARAAADVVAALETDVERGLETEEADRRLTRYGLNRLKERGRRSLARIAIDQFSGLVVGLLAAATLLSLIFDRVAEAAAIGMVLLINAAIGFVTEASALRSMSALRRLARGEATVRRSGLEKRVAAEGVVPGDVVLLRAGDVVPADIRLVRPARLQVDESMLTGESVPVEKVATPADPAAPLAERANMVYRGTAVTRGTATGIAVETGVRTELGRISELVSRAKPESTPLEKRLEQLARALVWLAFAAAALVAGLGLRTGRDLMLTVQTAIALAVAAVPEGLPIVATAVLARGLWRMARRNAVIERLASVETLGSTDIILTDKTGTLTENRMTVAHVLLHDRTVELLEQGAVIPDRESGPPEAALLRQALAAAVLCTEEVSAEARARHVGDPLERALLVAGASVGIERPVLLAAMPEVRREPFDPTVKLMGTVHADGDACRVVVKGAPEAVIEAATTVATREGVQPLRAAERANWMGRNHRLAEGGLRVIAVATKHAPQPDVRLFEGLTLLALIGLLDPPRPEVRGAITACRRAGIRVVMATGDQAPTARCVGEAVGLVEPGQPLEVLPGDALGPLDEITPEERERLLAADIFARTTPEQKLRLLDLHRANGSVVAMIGDGVNDAPALEQADIGIAMGIRGTQVAREAADIVLRDDRLESIVAAVQEGRVIVDNLRRFVVFLLSCNLSEILVVGLASVAAAPLPILPLQILFLNIVTDVFPALALGTCEGAPNVMTRPPRSPRAPFLALRHWSRILAGATVIMVAVLGVFGIALLGLDMEPRRAVTISFLALAFSQLFHVGNMTGVASGTVVNEVTRNPWIWGSLTFCALLLVAAVHWGPLTDILGTVDPRPLGWILAIGGGLLPLGVGRITHAARRRSLTPRRPIAVSTGDAQSHDPKEQRVGQHE